MIETFEFLIATSGEGDIQNITEQIKLLMKKSQLKEGFVLIFALSSTSSLAIMEWEDGLISDLRSMMKRIAPKELEYQHEKAWHDGNGHSHMRATLLGASLSIPLSKDELMLGMWQQIILAEFDIRPRKRKIVVQVHGEKE